MKYLFLIILITTNIFASGKYTYEDLKILWSEKNYVEFMDHALDIRPSERDIKWKEMLGDMASLHVKNAHRLSSYSNSTYNKVEEFNSMSTLKTHEFFQREREKYLLGYLKNCFNNQKSEKCKGQAKYFFDSTKTSVNHADIGIKLAKAVSSYHKDIEVWEYYRPATTGELAKFYCKKADVQDVLINKIIKKLNSLPSEKSLNIFFDSIASEECLTSIYPILKKMLKSTNVVISEGAYKILKSKKQINETEIRGYLVAYILNGPIVGNTFNNAWRNLEELSRTYDLRMKVLDNIRSYDPIPDSLFNMADRKKQTIIIEYLYKNFPEYIDFYTRTCLDYYLGKKKFKNGNPTRYCRELFRISKSKSWVNPAHRHQFNSLKF